MGHGRVSGDYYGARALTRDFSCMERHLDSGVDTELNILRLTIDGIQRNLDGRSETSCDIDVELQILRLAVTGLQQKTENKSERDTDVHTLRRREGSEKEEMAAILRDLQSLVHQS